MLDTETMGTSPDSVILTFGAVMFDPFSDEEPTKPLYLRLEIDEQTAMGRTINPDTLAWWGKQDQAAQDEAFSELDRVSLEDFATQLNRYIVGADKIWAQGTTFDICLLENLYRMMGRPIPWEYWKVRDSRTILDLGDDSVKKNNASAHNSLADSYFQALGVQSIYKQLGIKKK